MKLRPGTRTALLLAAFATLLGVIEALRMGVVWEGGLRTDRLGTALVRSLPIWWLWASFSPFVWWVVRRNGFENGRWVKGLASHLAAGVAVSLAHSFIYVPLIALLLWPGLFADLPAAWRKNLASNIPGDLVTYTLIAGGCYAFLYYRRFRDREARAAELEAGLQAARFEALTAQLHPHFVYNALNSVSTLVLKGDRDTATAALSRLGDLLRLTLHAAKRQELPLSEEVAHAVRYLDLERLRFGDRLTANVAMGPGTEALAVPAIVLQPLVENAIRHGVAARNGPASVRIASTRENGRLLIEVSDDGPGPGEGSPGVGLATTRARLVQLYGDAASLTLVPLPGAGTVARLELPARVMPS